MPDVSRFRHCGPLPSKRPRFEAATAHHFALKASPRIESVPFPPKSPARVANMPRNLSSGGAAVTFPGNDP
jgi:hypothetical protein